MSKDRFLEVLLLLLLNRRGSNFLDSVQGGSFGHLGSEGGDCQY